MLVEMVIFRFCYSSESDEYVNIKQNLINETNYGPGYKLYVSPLQILPFLIIWGCSTRISHRQFLSVAYPNFYL